MKNGSDNKEHYPDFPHHSHCMFKCLEQTSLFSH